MGGGIGCCVWQKSNYSIWKEYKIRNLILLACFLSKWSGTGILPYFIMLNAFLEVKRILKISSLNESLCDP
jgi:hypothetical protein